MQTGGIRLLKRPRLIFLRNTSTPLNPVFSATHATRSRPFTVRDSTPGTTTAFTRQRLTRPPSSTSSLPPQELSQASQLAPPRRKTDEKMADEFVEGAGALDDKTQKKGGGPGGGRKGGKGGRGGGGAQSREMLVSKALSKLLRHQAENAGIQLDEGGYAPLDKVLAYGPIRSLQVTFSDIQSAVTTSDKQRFALKANAATNPTLDETSTTPAHWLIRANQGHSIKIDSASLLTPITLEANNLPEVVVHGTYFAFWKQIEESGGLKRMGRNHVHFAIGLPGDEKGVVSGMRKDAEMLVYVDIEKALREDEGMKWWISENGVVLTEGDEEGRVPCRLFREVVGRDEGVVGALWRDGEKIGELPEGLKMRAPPGKGGRGGRGGGRRGGGGRS
ncbi:hypothetical protein EsH8_IV_000880 [Colletotrichum jinshuiense]